MHKSPKSCVVLRPLPQPNWELWELLSYFTRLSRSYDGLPFRGAANRLPVDCDIRSINVVLPMAKSNPVVFALALIVLLLTTATTRADSAENWARMRSIQPRGYVCYRTDAPVRVDGKLDDDAWKAVPWTHDFVDIEGNSKPPPRFRTQAKMLWDVDNFYIAALMEEPHVWGTLTKHDAVIFHDNDFEVFIDPNGDNHEYYEFEINALNTGWDLFLPRPYKDGGRADNGWEIPGLQSAIAIAGTLNDPSDRDRGWSVEIAIPWNALRDFAHRPAPPRDGDQWRVNFSRVEWQHEIEAGSYRKVPDTDEDNWVWSPQGVIDMHRPERWGFVQFSTAAAGTARFKLDPAWEARETLMTVYHHQKAFHQKHHRWASTLQELALGDLPRQLTMGATAVGFQADISVRQSDPLLRLHVRQDSKMWMTSLNTEMKERLVTLLAKQAEAWNRGDIDEFMEYYWRSDQLTFSSGGTTTRGWTATMENYKRRYRTRASMGTLTLRELEVTPLGAAAALVLGKWNLARDEQPVGGDFSLIFRHINGRWLIIHDHTSRVTQQSE